jgi:outer membrane protein insertion porin family
MRRWLLAAAVVLSLRGQEPAPLEKTQARLESVRVTGNREIPAEKILAILNLKIGKTVSKDDFDTARERLSATGAFETVGYEYQLSADGAGFDFTVEVREVGEVFPYRFDGLPVADDVLMEALRAQEPLWGDRIPITATTRYVDTIVQCGVKDAVTWKVEEGSTGVETIVFQPVTVLPNIAEVRFKGNDALPTAALLRPISDVAVGIPYTEAALRERLDTAIRPLYEARGRIRVAFPKIAVEQAEKSEGVLATVTVEEGPVYRLGEVRYSGVAEGDAAQLARLADLRKGDTANFDDVKAAVAKVEKKYRDQGYLHVSSKVEREVRDDDRAVDLAIALDLGAQYRFGKLTIMGLDILSEPEIRKAWGQMEGRPYQPDYADAFLDRLRADKVFDNLGKTSAERHIDETAKTVQTTLTFSGAVKSATDAETSPGLGAPAPAPGTRRPGR